MTSSISILSGKGGVGKSSLALNLSYALYLAGESILLMDCDMGLANMDVLLGIAPEGHIQDILLSQASPAELLVPLASTGFDLLPANSGMADFAEIGGEDAETLRSMINPLAVNYSFMVLDIGAGISPTVQTFAAMTAMRVLVITPEPTSLTDGYALMKVMANTHGINTFHILVNQAETAAEGKKTFSRLAAACKRFLGFEPEYLGTIRSDPSVPEAVRRQKPFMETKPNSQAATDCRTICGLLQKLRLQNADENNVTEPLRKVLGE